MAAGYLFTSQDSKSTLTGYLDGVKEAIRKKGTDYVLGVDHEEWLKYFINTYTFVPLQIIEDEITVDFKGKISEILNGQTQPSQYVFELHIPFLGHGFLFHLQPSTFELSSKYAQVLCVDVNGKLVHTISLPNENKERFMSEKQSFIEYVKRHIPRINPDVEWYNNQIEPTFREEIRKITEANNKTHNFLKEIGVSVNKETVEVFQVPKYKQPEIIEPRFVKDDSLNGNSQIPTVSSEFYNDITEIINKVYRSVEKKPSIYNSKDEEALRDYILPFLETRYNLTTATGETFNKEGKTDILIRYIDGTNIFIAECKKWHGSKMADDSISQLFDRYLTWRDTKVAIITFVNEKDFSSIITKLHEAVKGHQYFLSFVKQLDDTTFEYNMMVPGDKSKIVKMRTLTFTMP